MEAYVFAETGAWKSFEELEEEMTLNELMFLVSACRRSDYKRIKMFAMAQGAEVDIDDEDYGFSIGNPGSGKEAVSGFEASHLPIGLGYAKEELGYEEDNGQDD
jgi:hypothetical protein